MGEWLGKHWQNDNTPNQVFIKLSLQNLRMYNRNSARIKKDFYLLTQNDLPLFEISIIIHDQFIHELKAN